MERLFFDNANISLQGPDALTYLGQQNQGCVFLITGFDASQVQIVDYRYGIIERLEIFFTTGDPSPFQIRFCSPAQVDVQQAANGQYLIILTEPTYGNIDNVLWVVVGIGNTIPAHDYVVLETACLGINKFAIFAVYQSTSQPQPVHLSGSIHHAGI